MKIQYKIGRRSDNDIVIKSSRGAEYQAKIEYVRGYWILQNLHVSRPVFVNGEKILERKLNKKDIIEIEGKRIIWANYLFEGDRQELDLRDIITYQGRISRANYRVLFLVIIGLCICVFFLPGVLVVAEDYLRRKLGLERVEDSVEQIRLIGRTVYIFGYTLIGILFLLVSIKRMRDTGNGIWKLLIPFYNLKLLFFEKSK